MEAMHRPGAAAMHEFLVVVQVEAIEVHALQALDLRDAKDLPSLDLERLAGSRLENHLPDDFAGRHRAPPWRSLAACSRSALRMSETRSSASPRLMVRSISSSCC